ncbi:MAG TPA: hypothetical protein VJQ43_02975 [Thermoplasmata archaeon]|nr:hypothetical protein [Thermoplasmata archaeon]
MRGARSSNAPDSSHVGHIYRAVAFGRSALGWFVGYAVVWMALGILEVPPLALFASAGISPGTPTFGAQALLGLVIVLGLFGLLPLAIGAVAQWRLAVRALLRDVPGDSPWVRAVVGPVRSAWRLAGVSLVVVVVCAGTLIGFLSWVQAQTSAGFPGPGPMTENLVGLGLLAVIALAQILTQITAMRAFALPIGGSQIPRIDRRLRRAVRLSTWTAPWVVVPLAVFGALVQSPGSLGPYLPLLAALGVASPTGLLVAAILLRRAYGDWLELATRLVGYRTAA